MLKDVICGENCWTTSHGEEKNVDILLYIWKYHLTDRTAETGTGQ
jgi:hypothetical protein